MADVPASCWTFRGMAAAPGLAADLEEILPNVIN